MRIISKVASWSFLLLLAVSSAVATPQLPDILVLNETEHFIYPSPLEGALTPEKRWELCPMYVSNCLNGFVASWEVRDNNLFLTEVSLPTKPFKTKEIIPLNKIFPHASREVPATWFSGTIVSPKFRLCYNHSSFYGGTYLAERLYKFNKGKLTSSSLIFPWLTPVLPYICVIALGVLVILLLRWKRRKRTDRGITHPID